MPEKKITDEEAIEHFKRGVLEKFTREEKEELRVVSIEPKEGFVIQELSFEEIYEHMLAGDEIGREHIEIEKNWMRESKKRGLE